MACVADEQQGGELKLAVRKTLHVLSAVKSGSQGSSRGGGSGQGSRGSSRGGRPGGQQGASENAYRLSAGARAHILSPACCCRWWIDR